MANSKEKNIEEEELFFSFYNCMHKRFNIASLKLLFLERPACKIGSWRVSGNMPLWEGSHHSMIRVAHHVFTECIWFMLNTYLLLRIWNFGSW